jgi:endonuclease YncB( thermonuclease family)
MIDLKRFSAATNYAGGLGVGGSNPLAPTILSLLFNALRFLSFSRFAGLEERKGTERHGCQRKVPRKSHAVWLICSLFGFFCLPGQAPGQQAFYANQNAMPPIIGRATVSDGDTVEIGGRKIRFQGIDAPETSQLCEDAEGAKWRCGGAATLALDALIAGRIVSCQQDARDAEDRSGRALALCRAGETELNLEMVRRGHAVAYHRYLVWQDGSDRPYKADFAAAERAARLARIGLWQGRFDLPEVWRASRRGRP